MVHRNNSSENDGLQTSGSISKTSLIDEYKKKQMRDPTIMEESEEDRQSSIANLLVSYNQQSAMKETIYKKQDVFENKSEEIVQVAPAKNWLYLLIIWFVALGNQW